MHGRAGLGAAWLLLLAGCASQPQEPAIAEPYLAALEPPLALDGALADDDWVSPTLQSRRASTAAHATLVVGKSIIIEPLIRPFSTVKALYSLVIKSTASFSRRVALDTVQFGRLEQRPIPELSQGPGMDLERWERELDGLAGTATRGTVNFLIDGEEFFSRLIETIEAAEDSIDVRTYIFDNDDFAVQIADLLRERSREVDVRVLLDGIGALLGTQVDPKGMPRDFEPPISMSSYLERGSPVKVRTSGNPWLTGDHTKSTIIDGKVAFLGGMNIGREYRYEWHDLMVEVSGPIVDLLQRDLDIAWSKAGWFGDLAMTFRAMSAPRARAEDVGEPVRVLVTRDHDSQIYRAQLAAIRRAQSYIYIENSYFSDDATLYELAKARRRGVDVRVILPDDGNHAPLNYSNEVAINVMLRNGIRVFLFPGMSHVKAAIIDGWACVGSANFDKLSLQINEELNIATSSPPVVDDLMQRVFVRDFERSEELTEERPLRWTHHLAEFVSDEIL
ncbi:MAG TPA: phosphatidylserine/phosphatidylglycerophosphate/cardiolipin synthase family protein [Gammaproteobacteria bacterium]|nr:phosphatidylserine/phosphatidylglycerophosphate/cardiolipin synthase family protein [Gammaproteobacteria bacterium]